MNKAQIAKRSVNRRLVKPFFSLDLKRKEVLINEVRVTDIDVPTSYEPDTPTLEELKTQAKKLGIKGYNFFKNRETLIKRIVEARQNQS